MSGTKTDGLSLPATCIADAGDTAFYLARWLAFVALPDGSGRMPGKE